MKPLAFLRGIAGVSRFAAVNRIAASLDAFSVGLGRRWQEASPRDQRALRVGAALGLVILVFGVSSSLSEREQAIRERITQKQALLENLPMALAASRRLQRLGTDASLPLPTLAGRIAASAGATAEIQPTADGGARLQLDAIPADSAAEMLADFAALRLHARSLRLDAAAPGKVNLLIELGPRGS